MSLVNKGSLVFLLNVCAVSFFFLCLRLWLELPVKCWIRVERMYSFAMLAGGEKHSALSIKKDVNINFLRLGEFLSIPILLCVCVCCSGFLFKSWREVEFFNCFFYTCGDDLSFCFWFWSVDMVKYNDFSIAEPTLHSWDKHIYNSLSFLNIAGFNVLTFYSRFLCPCSWQMGL